MMTLPALAANALEEFLRSFMRSAFGSTEKQLAEIVPNAAHVALECIGNSDALYHNVEHTLLVTLAAHEIFCGRMLQTHQTAHDSAHIILACLSHDIAYVSRLFQKQHAYAAA